MARRGYRKVAEAFAALCRLVGLLVEGDRERGGAKVSDGKEGVGDGDRRVARDCRGCQVTKRDPSKLQQLNRDEKPVVIIVFFKK